MVYIYGLLCPLSGDIRYIGKSVNPKRRLNGHLTGAKTGAYNHHTSRWIRKLDRNNLRPDLVVLQELKDGEDWRSAERDWISAALASGWPLTNSTAGGEGLDYIRPEDRDRYRANKSLAMKRYAATPEGRARLERMVAAANEPEAAQRRAVAVAVANRRPEYRKKMRRVNAEINARSEVKTKKSRASKAMWRDDATRVRIMDSFSSDECKRKQSEAKVRSWADPDVGRKLRAIHSSEEVRAKKSESKAKNWADPEYRELMSQRLKAAWAKRKAKQGA